MRRPMRWRTVVVILAALGCATRAASAERPDVVLIVVDTLRADRLGVYGNERGLTPFLDSLARRAHVLERAYAQAPWTNPSVASIFTSRYPSQHGIVGFDSVLAGDETTLAEVLKRAGYATGAFSANGLITRQGGFDQGFEVYRADVRLIGPAERFTRPAKRADEISRDALRWLDSLRRLPGDRKPVFLYLHYMEPHSPYAPPPDLLQQLRGTKPRLDVRELNKEVVLAVLAPPAPEVLDGIRDTYDAEVMAVDAALGRLMPALAERGIGEGALVVITADHGEELQDHGSMGHGRTLYDEVLRVPLIVRTPNQKRGGVLERLTSSVDLAPTILDILDLEIPATFEGGSFARDLEAQETGTWVGRLLARLRDERPRPAVFSERYPITPSDAPSHRTAVVLDGSKVIAWSDRRPHEFFELTSDPHEQQKDGVGAKEQKRLLVKLDELRQRVMRNRTAAEKRAIDPQTRDALRALGYTD
jgi:arylsulfatase A-like enzyme